MRDRERGGWVDSLGGAGTTGTVTWKTEWKAEKLDLMRVVGGRTAQTHVAFYPLQLAAALAVPLQDDGVVGVRPGVRLAASGARQHRHHHGRAVLVADLHGA